MSVINQMLKDLDQRSPESNKHSPQIGTVALGSSPKKIALITGIGVFAVCFISFYIWQLINENKALKSQQIINSANASNSKNVAINRFATSTVKNITETQDITLLKNKKSPVNSKVTDSSVSTVELANKRVALNSESIKPSYLDKASVNNRAVTTTQIKEPISIVNNSVSRVTPAKKVEVIEDTHSHSGITSDHSHDSAKRVKTDKANTNKMSVSRRQLSADELAEQKLTLAEKALGAKQIQKAEKLLEDVVIIRPSDSQTRKKLAALWFGRQAYQDATNLLSQGIALNNKDSSLRMMKARIHLKQGQVTAALNTLTPLAQLKDEQYQIMLANTAQQAQQNKVAVSAYKMLIAMQPDIGRWYLGLAVLYDKNSEFNLASVAYRKALTKTDLSVSSEDFVKQRIQVIGQ